MQELKSKPVWLLWKLTDNKKRPISAITGHETGSSQAHAHEWTTYSNAAEKMSRVEAKKGKEGSKCGSQRGSQRSQRGTKRGSGFIIPEGYFFLDVDHQEADSPLVRELMLLLPTYCEVSPSGNGVHFYGKCDINRLPITTDGKTDDKAESNGTDGKEADGKRAYSKGQRNQRKLSKEYYTKNPQNGLELYIGGLTNRFSTFTGNRISEAEGIADCTEALLQVLEQKMKKSTKCAQWGAGIADADDAQDSDDAQFLRLTEADIPAILSDLRKQKNAKKFISLFDDGEIPARKTQSEADAALCAMIAFRAGPNPELIDSIFRQSALYRNKWDREDYASRTIEAGIEACHGNFHPAVRRDPAMPPFIIIKKGKPSVSSTMLASYVKEQIPFIIVRASAKSDARIYVYRNGVYSHYAKDVFTGLVKGFIEAFDHNLVKMHTVYETVSILCNDENYVPSNLLNSDARFVNVKNGLLDIKSMKLLPHSPDVYSTIQIPIDYDPSDSVNPAHSAHSAHSAASSAASSAMSSNTSSNTPVFDRYLDTLADGQEDKKRFLLEFLGACLSNVPGHYMKKALFMYGPGDSGKSQLKLLAERLIGEDNHTGIDLSQMEARFGSADIYGKRLAGSADMSFMTISELKIFKKATGGDTLFAEFKGKDSFKFIYKGLLWFVMNKLPKFGGDNGQWVYNRIIPIYCPNVIPEAERDPDLLDKMYEERAGIFYKAIMAFRAVIANGYRFHIPAEAKEKLREYRVDNNSAIEFFETMMEQRVGDVNRNDKSTVTAIYKVYKNWYTDQDYKLCYRKTHREFFTEIADYIGEKYADMTKDTHAGTSLRDYVLKKEVLDQYPFGI